MIRPSPATSPARAPSASTGGRRSSTRSSSPSISPRTTSKAPSSSRSPKEKKRPPRGEPSRDSESAGEPGALADGREPTGTSSGGDSPPRSRTDWYRLWISGILNVDPRHERHDSERDPKGVPRVLRFEGTPRRSELVPRAGERPDASVRERGAEPVQGPFPRARGAGLPSRPHA